MSNLRIFIFVSCSQKKKNIYQVNYSLKKTKSKPNVVGFFHNSRLGCLLPRYGPIFLGRRVKTDLIATHTKPSYAQTKAPLLKPWSHAHDKGSYYKRVMAGRYNITTKGICLLSARKMENY